MKTLNKTADSSKKPKADSNQSVDSSKALIDIAQRDVDGVLHLFDTSLDGLTETEAKRRLGKSGPNEIDREKPIAWYIQLLKTVTNPLAFTDCSGGGFTVNWKSDSRLDHFYHGNFWWFVALFTRISVESSRGKW